MDTTSQYGQRSGFGNGSFGSDGHQSGNWCKPVPVCPPTVPGETDGKSWEDLRTVIVTDSNTPQECDTNENDSGDTGWSWPGADGCCGAGHHSPWQSGGFGHYGSWNWGMKGRWQSGWGNHAPWQFGHGEAGRPVTASRFCRRDS